MSASSSLATRRRTRIFRTGNSLAVRLPVGWSKEGHTVALSREGARIVIEPDVQNSSDLLRVLERLGPLSAKIKRPKLGPFRPRLAVEE